MTAKPKPARPQVPAGPPPVGKTLKGPAESLANALTRALNDIHDAVQEFQQTVPAMQSSEARLARLLIDGVTSGARTVGVHRDECLRLVEE